MNTTANKIVTLFTPKEQNKQQKRELQKVTPQKRVVSQKWDFNEECYEYNYQVKMITNIIGNNYNYYDEVSKTTVQEITKKIYGYKQQDIIKKHFNKDTFISLESVLNKLTECQLICRYCKSPMLVLYDLYRQAKQWSVDRIENDQGHNTDNFHLACLECNLKRRRRTDEKFLFTKQLNLIKMNT